MEYPLEEPPFEVIKFINMTENEANQYFKWFMNEIPVRLNLLKELYVWRGGKNIDSLDYSPQSLIHIWRWYLKNVNVLPKTNEEYERDLERTPEYIHYSISKNKVELGWIQVAMDIGIYMSLCFLKNYDSLKWSYATDPLFTDSLNKPVITGFNYDLQFNHMRIMYVAAFGAVEGDAKSSNLYDIFNYWTETYL